MDLKWARIGSAEPAGGFVPDKKYWLWCADIDVRTNSPIGARMGDMLRYDGGRVRPRGDGMSGDWTFTHWCEIILPVEPPK